MYTCEYSRKCSRCGDAFAVASRWRCASLQNYMKAQEAGNPEALKGFVGGFNSQAKFLMPLVSKHLMSKKS